MKVLLIEDDLLEQARFSQTVKQLNLEIDLTVANDGSEAIQFLKKNENLPELILLDLHMPGQNGLEFLKEIKTYPNINLIPTIAFTSSKDPDEINACYELGVNSFIHKPIKPMNYKDTITHLFSYWYQNSTAVQKRKGE